MATEHANAALKYEMMGIKRPLKDSGLASDDAIKIIIGYVLMMYVEQYKYKDLPTIPYDVTHTCMLHMEITQFGKNGLFKSEVTYEGEVDVRRTQSDTEFDDDDDFMFTLATGKVYMLSRGRVHPLIGYSNTDQSVTSVQIDFEPHKFE